MLVKGEYVAAAILLRNVSRNGPHFGLKAVKSLELGKRASIPYSKYGEIRSKALDGCSLRQFSLLGLRRRHDDVKCR